MGSRMNVLLEAVREARELRDVAEREFRRALVRAHESGVSLRVLAKAASMTHQGVFWHIKREERKS